MTDTWREVIMPQLTRSVPNGKIPKIQQRIRTKFSANFTKQTQFFPFFHPKTKMSPKNKPNTNPNKPNISPKTNVNYENKANTKPIQNLSSIGAYLLLCQGPNFSLKIRVANSNEPNVQESKYKNTMFKALFA